MGKKLPFDADSPSEAVGSQKSGLQETSLQDAHIDDLQEPPSQEVYPEEVRIDSLSEKSPEKPAFFFDRDEFLSVLTEEKHHYAYFLKWKPLQDVLAFFESVAVEFHLDMSYFNRIEDRYDFYRDLKNFMLQVDSKHIQGISNSLKKYPLNQQFPHAWKNHFRTACYFAFFIHYTQRRKDGSSYVDHPIRAATAGSAKVGLLDQETLCATVLHDTLEDGPYKGLIAQLGLQQEDIPQFIGCMESFIKKTFSSEVLLLLQLVTKKWTLPNSSRKPDRLDHLLDFILQLGDQIDRKNFHAVKALLVKEQDRLDNADTLSAHDEHKKNAIWTETAYFFLPLLYELEMVNAADWMAEFLYFMDKEARDHEFQLDRSAQETTNLMSDFRENFNQFLQDSLPDLDLREGRDYVWDLRKRGLRFRSSSRRGSSSQRSSDSDAMSTGSALAQQRGFKHYLLLTVLNQEHSSGIAAAAKIVLESMFPYNAAGYLDQSTQFGRLFQYRTDRKPFGVERRKSLTSRKKSQQVSYGSGTYHVSDSAEKSRSTFFGLLHSVFIDGNTDASNKMMSVFSCLVGKARHLNAHLDTLYALHDFVRASDPENAVASIRGSVQNVLDSSTNLSPDLFSPVRSKDQGDKAFVFKNIFGGDIKNLEHAINFVKKQVLMFFVPTISIRVRSGHDVRVHSVPKGSNLRTALAFIDPKFMCATASCDNPDLLSEDALVTIESMALPPDLNLQTSLQESTDSIFSFLERDFRPMRS